MKVRAFSAERRLADQSSEAVRLEVTIIERDEQHKVILLDAEDSFDVIIHYPNGERECVWSIAKEPEV